MFREVFLYLPGQAQMPCIIYITQSIPLSLIIRPSFFRLQTSARLWSGADGLVRGAATGCKNLTEHRYTAGFSSNAGGQTFDKFQYKARTILPSLSMDMNVCQSLETLCLNQSLRNLRARKKEEIGGIGGDW